MRQMLSIVAFCVLGSCLVSGCGEDLCEVLPEMCDLGDSYDGVCTPDENPCEGLDCGEVDDGCDEGNTVLCGSCADTNMCVDNLCVTCESNCANKICGEETDSCGNAASCGTCEDGATCSGDQESCVAEPSSYGAPFGSSPMEEAIEAMNGGSGYKVNKHLVWSWPGAYYTFEPDDSTPTQGIIIYPGALVDVRSYAVLAKRLAKKDYLVALVPMPLDLSLLGVNRADRVISDFGDIEDWAISGHSLGGVMACNYARGHQSSIDAVILLASYPSGDYRLDGTSLKVLTVFGTNDGLTTLEDIQDSVQHLPAEAEFYEIEGGNHSQFGYYSPDSSGDNPADISRSSQTYKIYKAIKYFMSDL